MRKSVLVMETPEDCESCVLHGGIFHSFCKINCRDIKDTSTKPDWCPLKPLPEKMKLTGNYNGEYSKTEGKTLGYKVGWNACINEITGEVK